jgi:hypothetical protein
MSFNRRAVALLLTMSMALSMATGCSSTSTSSDTSAPSSAGDTTQTTSLVRLTASDLFSNRDTDPSYEESEAVALTLSKEGIECSSNAVKVDGTTATIKKEGVYVLSGELSEGQIIIDADKDKVQLVLDNVNLTCANSAAIYVKQADKVFLTLAENSQNTLSTTGEFEADGDTNVDGVIFSKDDLTINGSGELTIQAETGHGIVSKDELTITGGTLNITASGHALSGKDCVCISDGVFNLTAGRDGIHSDNGDDEEKGYLFVSGGTFTIQSDGDGLDASALLQIEDGTFTITAGGGSANAEVKTDSMGFGGGRGGFADPNGTKNFNFKDKSDGISSESDNDAKEIPSGDMPTPDDVPGDMSTLPDMPENMPTQGDMTDHNQDDGNHTDHQSDSDHNGGQTAPQASADQPEVLDTTGDESADTETDTATETSDKGIKSASGLIIDGGVFTIDSADDAIHTNGALEVTNGTMTLSTGDDGIHADDALTINGGEISILTSYEGIEGQTVTINDGNISLVASDDGINAASGADGSGFGGFRMMDTFTSGTQPVIQINGGTIDINASGDGVDSNGELYITGGTIYISGPTNGANGGIDYETTGTITGGTLIALGAATNEQYFSEDSTQGSILVSVSTGNGAISLTDKNGTELISYTPAKEYSVVLISCPGLTVGETYTLTTGSETTTIEMDTLQYGASAAEQGFGGMGGGFGRGGKGGQMDAAGNNNDQNDTKNTTSDGNSVTTEG